MIRTIQLLHKRCGEFFVLLILDFFSTARIAHARSVDTVEAGGNVPPVDAGLSGLERRVLSRHASNLQPRPRGASKRSTSRSSEIAAHTSD